MNTTRFPCLEDAQFNPIGHVGFGFLAASYLMKKTLHLRVCLTVSNALLAAWGSLALPFDACVTNMVWSSLFFVINAVYACQLHCRSNDDL